VTDRSVVDRLDVDDDVRDRLSASDAPVGAVGLERDDGLVGDRPRGLVDDAVAHREAERASRRLEHALGGALVEERVHLLLHDVHEGVGGLGLQVDGDLRPRLVGQDRDAGARREGGVDGDRVQAGGEHQERHRIQRIGLGPRRMHLSLVDVEAVDRELHRPADGQIDDGEGSGREAPGRHHADHAGLLHGEGGPGAVGSGVVLDRDGRDAVLLGGGHDFDLVERGQRIAPQQRVGGVGGEPRLLQLGRIDADARYLQRVGSPALREHVEVASDERGGAVELLVEHGAGGGQSAYQEQSDDRQSGEVEREGTPARAAARPACSFARRIHHRVSLGNPA